LGDGDDDQNHEELGPVASSTSDATVRDAGGACSRPARSRPYEGELKLPRAPTKASEG
jgi:hypothetical protein